MEEFPVSALKSLAEEVAENTMELRVSKTTPVRSLATSILRCFDEHKRVTLSCIGAPASHQALKAIAAAMGEVGSQGSVLCAVPAFDVKHLVDKFSGEDVDRTSIRLMVFKMPVTL